MSRSSDYSYLSLHDGNHILKFLSLLQNPGAAHLSSGANSSPAFTSGCFEGLRVSTDPRLGGKRSEPLNASNGKCLAVMPDPTCLVQSILRRTFSALCWSRALGQTHLQGS